MLPAICPKPYFENWIFPYPYWQRMAFDDRRKLATKNMWQELCQSSQLIDYPERDLIVSRGLLCCLTHMTPWWMLNFMPAFTKRPEELIQRPSKENKIFYREVHRWKTSTRSRGCPRSLYTQIQLDKEIPFNTTSQRWNLNIKQARKHFISFQSFNDRGEETKIYVQNYFRWILKTLLVVP